MDLAVLDSHCTNAITLSPLLFAEGDGEQEEAEDWDLEAVLYRSENDGNNTNTDDDDDSNGTAANYNDTSSTFDGSIAGGYIATPS